ncbi:lysophospholipid acyltransferase family protein [Solilutibacter silvestris]|uniref:Acyltransferase n=1 Tax=Solilutibacter silvestris TaxID=1645665 RepID=A0A2K1Q0T3_9GAMM|nr:lysophospholipid acyltransferase family protein [Lysobacter silvestris]PNS08652.1 Acyltransferase [Lysobacter silvestris]
MNEAPVQHPPTPATDGRLLPLPPHAPWVRNSRFSRWFGRTLLHLGGWRMVGAFPDVPKLVLIGAPHSSNWDGVWGFAAKMALGLDIRIIGKKELFWWPMGPILRRLGVIPIDRRAPGGFIEQIAGRIRSADQFWLGVAPEGTRKQVREWKSGFWKIAHAAEVPVLFAYFHYPDKVIGIGPLLWTSDDPVADMVRIREWYRPWQGKNHGTI